ncbi:MAG: carbohydrate-binding protein [Cytophagaceae bacterium]|nr:carbohydrate-binding protein [Cytophagaceae bacterium]
MKKGQIIKSAYLFLLLILTVTANGQFRVIGYLPTWSNLATNANNTDWSKITHINIAFINPTDASGTLGPTTGVTTAVQLAHDNNVKILISLGGASAPTYYSTLLTDANRPAFINKIVQYVNTYNLDGVDVDLEGDAIDSNYEKFIVDLKDTLSQLNKLTTAALASWNGYAITNTALAQFDFINAMAYDATGPWSPNSPGQHSSYQMAVNDLNYWINTRGVSKDKVVLGVPFYGYGFNSGTANSQSYRTIITNWPAAEYADQYSAPGGWTYYYNGRQTIKNKTALALSDAGGIMIWELTLDAIGSKSLLSAIDSVVDAASNNLPPTTSITSPANHAAFTEGDTITITADAADTDGSITKVSFYAGTFKIGEDLSAPYSIQWIGAGAGTYYLTARATDNALVTVASANDTISIVNAPTLEPLGGNPWPIPGKIEAENFDIGGNGVAYNDLSAANNGGVYRTGSVDLEACTDAGGGYNVGWTQTGEWLKYTVDVAADGLYDIKVRVATQQNGKNFYIEMDGVNISGAISVPNTGGWQNWQTVTKSGVSLTAGQKVMRFVMTTGNFNLNYIEVVNSTLNTKPNITLNTANIQPNPFNGEAKINFSLKSPRNTKIILFDQLGKQIAVIEDSYFSSGDHEVTFDAGILPEGVYIYQIISGDESLMIKGIKQ